MKKLEEEINKEVSSKVFVKKENEVCEKDVILMTSVSEDDEEIVHSTAIPQMKANCNIPQLSLPKAIFKAESNNPFLLAQELISEIVALANLISKKWYSFLKLLSSNNQNLLNSLIKDYEFQIKNDFNNFILPKLSSKPSEAQMERFRADNSKRFTPTVKAKFFYN